MAHRWRGGARTPFSGRGRISVENGTILLGKGILTGITRIKYLPKANDEVRLESMRSDVFAGITFPVHDSFCSWINGAGAPWSVCRALRHGRLRKRHLDPARLRIGALVRNYACG
jgi:hypothetical protein